MSQALAVVLALRREFATKLDLETFDIWIHSAAHVTRKVNKSSKQLDIRPHRRRARIFHSYSPGGTNVTTVFLGPMHTSLFPSGI